MVTKSSSRKKRTFIEEARRQQIVSATIEIIAELGIQQATLAEIANALDISQSVISYHFDGKSDLIEETINTILTETNAYVKERVDIAASAADKLRAYIDAHFEFERAHRDYFVALVDLWGSFGSPEEKRRFNATAYDPCRRHLEKILGEGEKAGEFRAFPTRDLASTIQAAIDGITLQWVFAPDAVDLDACRDHILAMLDCYMRKENANGNPET